jgi:aldose 1-epimerase
MAGDIQLNNGILSLIVRPSLGASVVRFDYIRNGGPIPLFRPEAPHDAASAFDLACQVLIPWSNRISSGGFRFRGRHYALMPNIAGEPYPNHGNGFMKTWDVLDVAPAAVSLRLNSIGPGPYRYEAELNYRLSETRSPCASSSATPRKKRSPLAWVSTRGDEARPS